MFLYMAALQCMSEQSALLVSEEPDSDSESDVPSDELASMFVNDDDD